MEKKFYEKQWFMWVTLIIFAPVGIFCLWKYKHLSKNVSIACTVIFALIFLVVVSPGESKKNQDTMAIKPQKTINKTVAPTADPTPVPTLSEEQKAKIEEIRVKAEADEKAKKEKKAEEERIGYDTGITYKQLARTPDDYKGKKVKFVGKVVQVMEGDGETQLRIAVNDDYDMILYVVYKSNITSTRILEKDNVTVRGLSSGLLTYKSTMGGNISIPSVLVQKIDLN